MLDIEWLKKQTYFDVLFRPVVCWWCLWLARALPKLCFFSSKASWLSWGEPSYQGPGRGLDLKSMPSKELWIVRFQYVLGMKLIEVTQGKVITWRLVEGDGDVRSVAQVLELPLDRFFSLFLLVRGWGVLLSDCCLCGDGGPLAGYCGQVWSITQSYSLLDF